MKTIGIIGGFSPEATTKFYLELIRLSRLQGMETQPHIIVWNVPVPKKFEEDLLIRGKGVDKIKAAIIHAAKELEKAGSNIIVLPCNTLHVLANSVSDAIGVPFLNIIKTARKHLEHVGVEQVGLLGSGVTVSANLFAQNASGISYRKPPERLQQKLNVALMHSVTDHDSDDLRIALGACVADFRNHGIHDVLLACTDFSGICPIEDGIRVHDTMTLLAHEVVNQIQSG